MNTMLVLLVIMFAAWTIYWAGRCARAEKEITALEHQIEVLSVEDLKKHDRIARRCRIECRENILSVQRELEQAERKLSTYRKQKRFL